MDSKKYLRIKKLLIIGIISSLITIFGGEIPIGWVVNPEADNEMLSIIMGYGKLSLPQLACGVLFGGIGIPMQYYGYKAVSEIAEIGGNTKCSKLIHLGAVSIAFLGGIVHVMCVALMYILKFDPVQPSGSIPQSSLDFMLWLVLPITVVFMLIYLPMTIAMIIPVVKGKTVLPKWAAVFNPLASKVIIPIAALFLPNTKFVNALNMADMGLGSLITFVGLLVLLKKYAESEKILG